MAARQGVPRRCTSDTALLFAATDKPDAACISAEMSAVHFATSPPPPAGTALAVAHLTLTRRQGWRRRVVPLLTSVSMYLAPGALGCVLGSDPAQTRALLAVLAGTQRVSSRLGAYVMANARRTRDEAYRVQVAYIATTHGCVAESTVSENVCFALRMHQTHTSGTRLHDEPGRVREALRVTELDAVGHVKAERLSAAQRYQLAIAMELVREPAVVLLEEPLHHFHLAEVQTLVRILQRLVLPCSRASYDPADPGPPWCTVLFSSTDLPWPLYDVLSDLTVLSSEGRVLYTGAKAGVVDFLQDDLGILHVTGEMIADLLAQMEDAKSTRHTALVFANSAAAVRVGDQLEMHQRQVVQHTFASNTPPQLAMTRHGVRQVLHRGRLLAHYAVRRNLVGPSSLIPWATLFAAFLLMALVLAITGAGQSAMQNRRGVIFFLLSCAMQVNAVFLDAELADYKAFVHLRTNRYCTSAEYFMATTLRLLLPRIVFALLGAACAFFVLRAVSLMLALVLGLTSLSHACLTVLAVYCYPHRKVLWRAQHLYYGYCALVSGFLVHLSSIPRPLQALSLLRLGYGGLVASELRGNPYACDLHGSDSGDVQLCYTGDQYLEFAGVTHDSWGNASSLLLIFVAMNLTLLACCMQLSFDRHGAREHAP